MLFRSLRATISSTEVFTATILELPVSVSPVSGRIPPRAALVEGPRVKAEATAGAVADAYDAGRPPAQDRTALFGAAFDLGNTSHDLAGSVAALQGVKVPWLRSPAPARVQILATFKQGLQDAGAALGTAERQLAGLEDTDVAAAAGVQMRALRLSFDSFSRIMGEALPAADGDRNGVLALKKLTGLTLRALSENFENAATRLAKLG